MRYDSSKEVALSLDYLGPAGTDQISMSQPKTRFARASVQDGVTVVTVTAEQIREADQAYGLRDEILEILNKSSPSCLVLDLGELTFVGSIGFLAFLGVRRHLAGGRIVIPPIRRRRHRLRRPIHWMPQ